MKQVPLIKNPSYQPPKPISLNTNYEKFLGNARVFAVPPEPCITHSDVEKWINESRKEIDVLKSHKSDKRIEDFQSWIHQQKNKVAPGFSFDEIMRPHKVDTNSMKDNEDDVKVLSEQLESTKLGQN